MLDIVLRGRETAYRVLNIVGENSSFRYFRAVAEDNLEQELMVKIGVSTAQNGSLDREAFLLGEFREHADQLEAEYARKFPGANALNYTVGFPLVRETFVVPEQGGRRVIVMEFQASPRLVELIPVSFIRERDRLRVDVKTSAWIMGKFLKILVFAHSQGFAVGNLHDRESILIEKDHHLVTLLDWSSAKRNIDASVAREEIVTAAHTVWRLLGGSEQVLTLPSDDDPHFDPRYVEVLASLGRGAYSDASTAHTAFYREVEAIWERNFHPFTTLPLNEGDD